MTTRDDTTALPLLDRFELLKTAIAMIDEGVDFLIEDALESEPDLDMVEMLDNADDMRADAYISMFSTFVNDQDEARQLVKLLRLETMDIRKRGPRRRGG